MARRVRKILERCSEIQELAIVHHLDELSEEDMTTIGRAVKYGSFDSASPRGREIYQNPWNICAA